MKNIVTHGKNAFINQFSTKSEDDKVIHIEGEYSHEERRWIGCSDSVFFSAVSSRTKTVGVFTTDETHTYDD